MRRQMMYYLDAETLTAKLIYDWQHLESPSILSLTHHKIVTPGIPASLGTATQHRTIDVAETPTVALLNGHELGPLTSIFG